MKRVTGEELYWNYCQAIEMQKCALSWADLSEDHKAPWNYVADQVMRRILPYLAWGAEIDIGD